VVALLGRFEVGCMTDYGKFLGACDFAGMRSNWHKPVALPKRP
jgi:hypothetical protein